MTSSKLRKDWKYGDWFSSDDINAIGEFAEETRSLRKWLKILLVSYPVVCGLLAFVILSGGR